MKKHKLGILISGRGSNMESIILACNNNIIPCASVECVISNNAKAYGIERARALSIKTFIVEKNQKLELEQDIITILESFSIDLICLAGFMKVLSQSFIQKFHNKIINIHPSLLPLFKGLNAQKQALKSGAKFSGCTVHHVTADVDSGDIIKRAIVPILKNDTEESLSDRILKAEHKCYVKAIKKILSTNQ